MIYLDMNDIEIIKMCYKNMYNAMIDKDKSVLEEVLDDSFVLIHMTGMHQNKHEFIKAVVEGTLNYYSAGHQIIEVSIKENQAFLDGKSMVNAAVFGGGRHTWRLRQKIELIKKENTWLMKESKASVY